MKGAGSAGRRVTGLRVRERITIGPAGPVAIGPTVHCERRERAASVAECLACEYGAGLVAGEDGAVVRCTHPDARPTSTRAQVYGRRVPSDAERTPLSAVMTANVTCVQPDLRVDSLLFLLIQQGIGGAPVVDRDGRPLGVVSRADLVRLSLDPQEDATVADIMMPIAFTLAEGASVSQAAALMAYEDVHRVPVVSADGVVVGIVSSLDIVRWLARHDGFLVSDPNDPIAPDEIP